MSSATMSRCKSEKPSTRSGFSARMRSVRNVVNPPTRARSRAASGRRAVPGTPTTRSPAPTMNAISVVSAVRQTMRWGNWTGLLPYIVRSAPDARRDERHVDERRGRDRAQLGLDGLAGAWVDLVVGVVPCAPASLPVLRAEVHRGPHATGRIEPAQEHAVGLAVDERHFTGLCAAGMPRFPRSTRLAITILVARLDGTVGMPRHERSVEDARIAPRSLTPFLPSARARREPSLGSRLADDRDIGARLAVRAPREHRSEDRDGDAHDADARRRGHYPS